MAKIEKELVKVTKVRREEGEQEQEFFARIVTAGNTLFDKEDKDEVEEKSWQKLSEEAQHWFNAATDAKKANQVIPNFDGTTPEVGSEADADTEEGEAEAEVEAQGGKGDEPGEEEEVKAESKRVKKPKKAAKAKETEEAPAVKAKSGKKKAAAKANGAKRGRKGAFSETDKITKVASKNPFREGSKAAKCYAQYKVGRTVKAVLEAGVPRSKLNRHMSKGVVTIG